MTARRNPDLVREQDRRKQAKRRAQGTPEQRVKIAARAEVRKAIARGDLSPGQCESVATGLCSGRINAHHEDYGKPLEVRWLCRLHHDQLHA